MAEYEKKPVASSLMRRLTLSRYVFESACQQSFKGEPIASLSLLGLHDATELFLQAAADRCEVQLGKNTDFLAYWSVFENKNIELGQLGMMKRFNAARVGLKHHGTFPAHSQIEEFRSSVELFLEANCLKIFDIEFTKVSLSSFIVSEEISEYAKNAEAALNDGKLQIALEQAVLGFRRALWLHRFGTNTDSLARKLYDPSSRGYDHFYGNQISNHLGSSGRPISEALERMQDVFGEALTILAYGLDYDGYRFLKTFGPVVHEFFGGGTKVEWARDPTTDEEIVRRCVAFSIDAALKLEAVQREQTLNISPTMAR